MKTEILLFKTFNVQNPRYDRDFEKVQADRTRAFYSRLGIRCLV